MSIPNFYKRSILCIALLLSIIALGSCEKDIAITIKTNDKRLIVVGEFTTDTTTHSIRLFCSGSLMSGKKQTVVTGAKVCLTSKTGTINFYEKEDSPGLYQTPDKCYGIGGQAYILSITNVDVDGDGRMDSFTSTTTMPVAVQFDSLVSKYGRNGDNILAVNNWAYYNTTNDGPDYVFHYMQINDNAIYPISRRLGSGEFSRFERFFKIYKGEIPAESRYQYFSLERYTVAKGDNLTFIGYNFTKSQYDFLKAFDNSTDDNDHIDYVYDKLKMPSNLPTNIEPSNKAAGYFLVYSISRISRVYQ